VTSTAATPPKPHLALRAATGDKHDEVDALFARYDLTDQASYAAFLVAHARVLPGIEAALAATPALPSFKPRTAALADDIARLGQSLPPAHATPEPADEAAAWGMFYVTEGSRLGGAMLVRSVPEDFPRAYLAAAHERGGWRRLLDELDAAAEAGDAGWLDRATVAARATFDAYAAAVRNG